MPKTLARTRHAKRDVKPPDGILHPCPNCSTEHHRFGRCADGVLRSGGHAKKPILVELAVAEAAAAQNERIVKEINTEPVMTDEQRDELLARRNEVEEGTPPQDLAEMRESLKGVVSAEARAEAMQETVAGTGLTVAEIKEHKLITDAAEIERLTPDELKRELKVRAALEEAEKTHSRQEAELGVKIARPEIMRRTNEKAGDILLRQLDHVMASAGVTAHVAANPTNANLKKFIPESEAQLTRDTLARIPEIREQKRQEAEAKEALKSHVNGEVPWVCESDPDADCYARVFYAASIEVVRKKAKAEPGWMFSCPRCRGVRVRLADHREGVAA